MARGYQKNLMTPIVGLCGVLCKEIVGRTNKTPNYIKHPYVDELKKNSIILFKYAMREMQGKNYYSRATEILEEIRAMVALLRVIGGMKEVDCVRLDVIAEEIQQKLDERNKDKGQNVKDKSH